MSPTGMQGPATSRPSYEGLLNQLMTNTLDQDYQVAAERRLSTPAVHPRSRRLTAVAVVLVFGAMIGISALRTQQQKPAAAAERDELIAQIQLRQHRLDRMHAELSALESDVARLQAAVSAGRSLARNTENALAAVAGSTGASEVTGPGIEITTDNAPGPQRTSEGGVILDSDLQALVNGLWTAGAEAISINGHRLTSLTAIRSAGRAITVDYRSLTPPYVIDAIGNPDTLPARFLETAGGQGWLALKANFGIRFDTVTLQDLVLPADPGTTLHEAHPVGAR
jgi:uncharacterized protein YlxW (UPF0749 family)